MRIHTWLAAVTVLSFCTAARGQSYTLKTKDFPGVGKSMSVTDSTTTRSSVRVTKDDMLLKEDKKLEVEEKQYTEKVLKAGAKSPDKYTDTYTRATKGAPGSPVDRSFAGKTIVYERKGDKVVVTAEGGGVDAKDLEDFAKRANHPHSGSEVMLPKHAVKVGETWRLGKEAARYIAGDNAADVDLKKFTGEGKLVKAYKKGDQQWGTIEVTLSLPIAKFGPLVLDKPITLQAKATLDTAIDGSSTEGRMKIAVTFKGRAQATLNNMNFVIDVAIEGDHRTEHTAEK